MATKARIENGIVREILTAEPFPPFHPSLVWAECGAEVKEGWTWDGKVFTEPVLSAEELNAPIKSEIVALEATQPRAVREATLTGDKTRLQAIEDQIAELRTKLV